MLEYVVFKIYYNKIIIIITAANADDLMVGTYVLVNILFWRKLEYPEITGFSSEH